VRRLFTLSGAARFVKRRKIRLAPGNAISAQSIECLRLVYQSFFPAQAWSTGATFLIQAQKRKTYPPRAPYGEQKLEAENLIRAAGGCAVRVFNLYGPNSTDPAQIIPRLVAAAQGDCRVSLNGDGLQKRDFVHRIDAAKALCKLVSKPISGGVFNLSSGIGTTMIDLVNLVFAEANREPQITWNPAVAGEARMICGDPGALKALTNWEPTIQLSEGIRDLLANPS
jgi:nucleoside-diphosphate-sugar epimerase